MIPYYVHGNSVILQTTSMSTIGIENHSVLDTGQPNIVTISNLDTGNAVAVYVNCSTEGTADAKLPGPLVDGVATNGVGTVLPPGGTQQFLIDPQPTLSYFSVSLATNGSNSSISISPGVIK